MENIKVNKVLSNHSIHMDNRKRLDITGVTEVLTFNEDLVVINTVMGGMNIKGRGMKVNKLNVDNGEMSIDGEFQSLIYTNKDNATRESFLKKMFK
jgi:sporulation protein YabP